MSDYIKREDATAVISKTLGSLGNSVITEINSLPGYATQDHARFTQESTQDLISRQEAIALVIKAIHGTDNKEIQEYLFDGLRKQMWSLPSAEPKTGWIPVSDIQKLQDILYMHIDSLEGTRNIVEAGMLSAWKEVAEYVDGMLGEDGEET